ncbi:MAG: hypothetical protein LUG93_12505 [Lachnospiraceae bacterium]|nr:hypothetical protein [Lachnospiraceae bacterium]MCD7956538.1 hypothetical protein [Lachnospiraceae bacterium]
MQFIRHPLEHGVPYLVFYILVFFAVAVCEDMKAQNLFCDSLLQGRTVDGDGRQVEKNGQQQVKKYFYDKSIFMIQAMVVPENGNVRNCRSIFRLNCRSVFWLNYRSIFWLAGSDGLWYCLCLL